MRKPNIVITKFKFHDLKTKGLKLLNRGKFKTSLWIINIVKKEEYNLKNVQLPIRLSIISVKQLGFNKPTQLKKFTKGLKKES